MKYNVATAEIGDWDYLMTISRAILGTRLNE
jgi:hypothetical protein